MKIMGSIQEDYVWNLFYGVLEYGITCFEIKGFKVEQIPKKNSASLNQKNKSGDLRNLFYISGSLTFT